METRCNSTLLLDLPPYTQLLSSYDPEQKALWYYADPKPRPCLTAILLAELRDFFGRIGEHLRARPQDVRYLVFASATPGIYSLGGDLELFARLVAAGDRDGLYDYGRGCVDIVHLNATNFGVPTLTTVTLVQGSALGGGFEGALSHNVVIAEQSAQMGFPEILFNMFPGMGAMSLLARRIELARAERLIQSGELHSARALWEMGVVDELAADGEGVRAVNDFIRRHERFANGRLAIRQARQRVAPVSHQELLDIVEIWVEAALRLAPRDLRVMERIVTAQLGLNQTAVAATTAPQPQPDVHEALARAQGA